MSFSCKREKINTASSQARSLFGAFFFSPYVKLLHPFCTLPKSTKKKNVLFKNLNLFFGRFWHWGRYWRIRWRRSKLRQDTRTFRAKRRWKAPRSFRGRRRRRRSATTCWMWKITWLHITGELCLELNCCVHIIIINLRLSLPN